MRRIPDELAPESVRAAAACDPRHPIPRAPESTTGLSAPVPPIESALAQALLAGQKEALERIAKGASLEAVLDVLTRLIETHSRSGVVAALARTDPDGRHLRHVSAPSLPPACRAYLDGLSSGPAAGAAGTAAWRRTVVDTPDIARDPLWAGHAAALLEHGLRAAWALPICSAGQELLGVFALYSRAPGPPAADDLKILALLVDTAAIALEHRRAEEDRARLVAIVTSCQDAILSKTLDGIITSWNPAAERLYGYHAAEAIGQHVSLIVPPERSAELAGIFERLRRGEPVPALETERLTRAGQRVQVSVSISPVRDAQGNVVGASAVTHDMTSWKQARAALEDQARTLETLHRINLSLAAKLDPGALVQAVIQAGRQVTGAEVAAFYQQGSSRTPGMPGSSAPAFPLPATAPLLRATLEGQEVVRSADLTADPRAAGSPPAAAPLRSYLAVPVVARSGDVLGGLFFGHAAPGVFDERAERIVTGIAAQTAVAMDNARLYAALRDSEQRLKLALQAGRLGAWEWRIRTGEVIWSPGLEALHGLAPGTFPGTVAAFQQEIHPDDRERVRQALARTLAEGGYYQVEYRAVRPDGRIIWFEARGELFRDAAGDPERMAGVCADVTERRRAEERFRLAVEASPSGVVLVDRSGRIGLVNSQAERLFGYAREELVGQSIELLVPRRLRSRHGQYRAQFQAEPRARPMGAGRDLYGLRKDGTEFPVEVGLTPLETQEGPMVLSTIVDITERRRAEQALRRANQQLQQKNQEMEQFVYTVSHDLKSPVVTALGFIGLLQEDLAEGRAADVQDSLARLERAARRMSELIDDLLQLSRIGRFLPRYERLDPGALARTLAEELDARLREAGASLKVADHLPPVWADRARLVEVFENLVNNALKYARRDDATLVIEIGGFRARTETRLFVRDNGPGIDAAYHKRIFGLFQRLDSGPEGTGVGLAIVAKIMKLHGGRAWVESTPGEGATFWLAFPNMQEAY